MKAIRFEATAAPRFFGLRTSRRRCPHPARPWSGSRPPGLNFIDVYQRTGLYPVPLPRTPGLEGAGRDRRPRSRGERPRGRATGSPGRARSAPMPRKSRCRRTGWSRSRAGVDSRTAAALMLQGMTAHYLVETVYPLGAGKTCLVHAAAGGVGLLLVQMAKRKGARVFATVSTDEKAALARGAGADVVILYTKQDFAAEVKKRHRRPRRRRGLRLGRADDLREGARLPGSAGHDGALRPVERGRVARLRPRPWPRRRSS